jgi:large subunit ribosomal protein L29
MMKLKELKAPAQVRELDINGLQTEAREITEHLMKLRFQLTSGQIENPNIIKYYRRGLARVRTILEEKERAQEASS